MKKFSFTLDGTIPSKKNAWKRSRGGGVHIAAPLRAQLDDLTYQLINIRNKSGLKSALDGALRIETVFYEDKVVVTIYVDAEGYKGQRSDLDNRYTTLQDLLQTARIITNDRQVYKYSVERKIKK